MLCCVVLCCGVVCCVVLCCFFFVLCSVLRSAEMNTVCCCCCLAMCLVLSCLVLSCLVLSCLALPCLVLSCLVLSCLVLSCLVLSCLALSCLVLVGTPPAESSARRRKFQPEADHASARIRGASHVPPTRARRPQSQRIRAGTAARAIEGRMPSSGETDKQP